LEESVIEKHWNSKPQRISQCHVSYKVFQCCRAAYAALHETFPRHHQNTTPDYLS
jgi:hypothetical protein